MKTFLVPFLVVVCFLQHVHSQSECPQGWTMYRDEKCYFLQTSYLSYEAAQTVCSTRGGSLASVKVEAQQTFLSNYLFNESAVKDEVWLGATRLSPTEFEWEDGTPVDYSNWGPESPSDNAERSCVAMQSQNSKMLAVEGSWRDVPCSRPTYFVCESEPVWSPEEVRKVLVETRKRLDDLVEQHKVEIGEILEKHEDLVKNPVPVGFVYPQLPGHPEPSALWPNNQWTEISAQFAGKFFRVVGGAAAEFGTVQAADSPRLTGAKVIGAADDFSDGEVPIEPGTWSRWLFTGYNSHPPYVVQSFLVSNPEIRPVNTAMRIWVRAS